MQVHLPCRQRAVAGWSSKDPASFTARSPSWAKDGRTVSKRREGHVLGFWFDTCNAGASNDRTRDKTSWALPLGAPSPSRSHSRAPGVRVGEAAAGPSRF